MEQENFCNNFCPMPSRIPDRTGGIEIDCDCEESECPFKDVDFSKVTDNPMSDDCLKGGLRTEEDCAFVNGEWVRQPNQTAREIFEEIEKQFPEFAHTNKVTSGFENDIKRWNSLSERWIKVKSRFGKE